MTRFPSKGIHALYGRYLFPYPTPAHTPCPRITSTHSNTADHIYIYHYWPSVLPPHRCRCTHTDSTICLHIRPTAPSPPPKYVTVSFKHISIVFFPLTITHQAYADRICHYSHTHTFLKSTCKRSVVMVLAVCFRRLSSFHPPPVRYSIHFHLFALFFSAVSFLFPLVAFTIPLRFDTNTSHVLCPCFQSQLTFHNLELPNRSTARGQPFRV
jgi:hypothetical protein